MKQTELKYKVRAVPTEPGYYFVKGYSGETDCPIVYVYKNVHGNFFYKKDDAVTVFETDKEAYPYAIAGPIMEPAEPPKQDKP